MEAFHKIKIKCPYEILEVEEIKIKNKPNEHGYLYLKGIVDDSINFKYAIEASTEDKICIYEQNEDNENNKETIIFNGKIQNISTNNSTDGIYHIEIEAYTSSFDLDIEEKSRSFQDIEMSYDDFLNIIMADFQMYDYTQCMNKPENIGFPRFQYKESSYKMIVRTASYLGINVYCDIINPSNAFYFGKPSGREYELEDDIDYTATLDINKYRESLVNNPDSHPTDFFYYEINTSKVMQIGDKITFKQKKFYIYSYESEYVRGELIYTYRLCREKGIWQDKIYNDKLKGISLEGKVLEVSGEQVKLHLNIDETQDQSKAAWFRYAPPTGNIMYSMPIVGTSANLYFPNERNEEPIVIGCVRKNGSSCEKFSDVNNRYFSTESGNNLDMLSDAINFSRPGLSANFNDGSGITLSSSSSLSINAGYVGMFAGNVSIEGKRKLVAERGASIISLENDFYNSAGIIKENGSDRASNEPFDDDPQNGAKENIKSAMEAAMQAAAGMIASAVQGSIAKIGECLGSTGKSKSGNPKLSSNIINNGKYLIASDSKNDKVNANDPLNLYSNKPWMNIDTNIKLPKNEYYITHDDGKSRQINEYEYDAEHVRNDKSFIDKSKYFAKYLYDRTLEYGSKIFEYFALIDGMTPEYAELYGDFTVGTIFETGFTIAGSGIKSASALKNSESLSEGEIIAGSGAGNLKGINGGSTTKPNQVHHYATNKNKTYTQQFKDITDKYGLNLDSDWNKELLPHQGRHPNAYHEFILDEVRNIDNIANGNADVFLDLYESEVKSIIRDNPEMMYKNYWDNLK